MIALMFALERRRWIIEHLRAGQSLTVAEAAHALGASEITVRRDLRALADSGLVVRTHGGAVLPAVSEREPSYREKIAQASEEKEAIARLALEIIQPGTSIVLGPGTTTLALARLLVGFPELTVLTNSLLVAEALMEASGVEVIVTGGTLRRSIHALVGAPVESAVSQLLVSQAFISGNGLTAERGMSTPSPVVAAADRAMAGAAQQVVVLADHTKVGMEAMCPTVAAERIDVLVTDSGADAQELEKIGHRNVRVRIAQMKEPPQPPQPRLEADPAQASDSDRRAPGLSHAVGAELRNGI